MQIAKWAFYRSEFASLRIDDILYNLEAALLCGHANVMKVVGLFQLVF